MHRFSLYPPNDTQQELRIRRFFMSVVLYGLCCVPMGLSVHHDIVPLRVMLIFLGAAALGNLALYLTMRLNYNKRFADPSLTMPQLVFAIGMVFYVQIYAGPARGSFLLALMVAFVFGCFKLSTRQMLGLSLLAILTYAATLPIISHVEGDQFRPTIEMTLWVTFSIFIPALAVVTGHVSEMRQKLASTNSLLADAVRKVTDLATRDELTGAYNRRHLLEMLTHEKYRADRGGGAFCICLIDLDHFKQVNDTYGHSAGDAVLKGLTATVHSAMRNTDLFARYGGEEFILVLPQTSLELARLCMERIMKAMQLVSFDGLPPDFRVTMSVGIAQYYLPEETTTTIERVDAALYNAKRRGRNRIELAKFPPYPAAAARYTNATASAAMPSSRPR